MTGLPRALSALLLLGGAVAWLLGPTAPAESGGAAVAAGPAQPWAAEEVWLEGPAQDPEEPQPLEAERAPVEPAPAALEEPATLEERVDEPASARSDALALVRRMLAVHARMAEP